MKVALIGGVFRRPGWRSDGSRTPEITLYEGLRTANIEVVPLSHYASELTKLEKFDIVHVNHLSWGALAAVFSRIFGGGSEIVYTAHAGIDSGLFRRLASRLIQRYSSVVIALSEAEAARYRYADCVCVIPNGIDVGDAFGAGSSAPVNPLESGLRLLFVGQLAPVKQVAKLIDAVAELRRHMEVRLRLVYHTAALERDLKKQSERLGLGGAVAFAGKKGAPDLWQEFQSAHALVLPSASEALPSVLSEAALIGVPVVASRVGGTASQVPNESWLVPPDASAEELAVSLYQLAEEWPERSLAAMAAANSAREKYGIDSMVDSHLQLYQSLIQVSDVESRPLPVLLARALRSVFAQLERRADRKGGSS